MTTEKIGIATACITQLKDVPLQYNEDSPFTWDIMFYGASTLNFTNKLTLINTNNSEEAQNLHNLIKESFSQAHISEGDKVAVLFKEGGEIRAIGSIGRDLWIDADDKFVTKTFKDLNIIITSLKVH